MSEEPEAKTEPSLVFERALTRHTLTEDILGLLTGTFTVSFGLYLLHAVGAVTGGTAGLSLLIGYVTSWPFAVVFALVNVPFAVLAIRRRGWMFTVRTAICIAVVSAFSALHPVVFRIEHIDPLYGTLAGNLLCGIGLLILFRHNASLGGFNIIALVLQDATGFRAGWTMMILDSIVVLCALFQIAPITVLQSALGVVLLNLVLALNHRPGRYIGR